MVYAYVHVLAARLRQRASLHAINKDTWRACCRCVLSFKIMDGPQLLMKTGRHMAFRGRGFSLSLFCNNLPRPRHAHMRQGGGSWFMCGMRIKHDPSKLTRAHVVTLWFHSFTSLRHRVAQRPQRNSRTNTALSRTCSRDVHVKRMLSPWSTNMLDKCVTCGRWTSTDCGCKRVKG